MDCERLSIPLKMDMETGEYYHDTETGEVSYTSTTYDVETGEDSVVPHKKFKVPRSCYTKPQRELKKNFKPLKATKQESELIAASIFLLPTMILFHPFIAILAISIEIFLHHWSHEKNKKLKSNTVYFQSPLHGIVKEFCGRCKEERACLKITKLQDIRTGKMKELEYLKRVVT